MLGDAAFAQELETFVSKLLPQIEGDLAALEQRAHEVLTSAFAGHVDSQQPVAPDKTTEVLAALRDPAVLEAVHAVVTTGQPAPVTTDPRTVEVPSG